jgi:hypothetical protein
MSRMPLQNRIDPFGAIHAVPARGLFTGNRGIIHDPATKTLLRKRWTNPAWIICTLDLLPGRQPRDAMGFNREHRTAAGWTELFFLDEVTALAAGHRPCFFCQRERAKLFLGYYADAFSRVEPKAGEFDRRLHGERHASSRKPLPPISKADIAKLPNGAMIASGDKAYAVRGDKLLPWSFQGYGAPISPVAITDPKLLTPPTTVEILRAGYRPVWHASAA